MSQDKAAQLRRAIDHVPSCRSEADLLRAASWCDEGIGPAEMNFPAEVIMFANFIKGLQPPGIGSHLGAIIKSAEMGMLQLAFFNRGEQPPCSFIMVCHKAGWRVGSFGKLELQFPPLEGSNGNEN